MKTKLFLLAFWVSASFFGLAPIVWGGSDCPEDLYDPVCGDDGLTYPTRCHAEQSGTTVVYTGECIVAPACAECHEAMPSGAHLLHASGKGYKFPCKTCHFQGMDISRPPDDTIQIGFSTFGLDNTKSIYYGDPSTAYQGTKNGSDIDTKIISVPPTDADYQTCKNVYCHSQGKRATPDFKDLPSSSPAWNNADADIQADGFKCNNCHNYPPGFDSHSFHSIRGYGCEVCHAATTADGRTISDKSIHVNGRYDVVPASKFYARKKWHPLNFAYTPAIDSGGTCSSNSCHQYWQTKDPKTWNRFPQEITDATLTSSQDTCEGTLSNPSAKGTLRVEVDVNCPSCVSPYVCDFYWGDGNEELNVPCKNRHTYDDAISFPNDPTGTVIGGFTLSWTVRDGYGTPLAQGLRKQRVDVCPIPNEPPRPNFEVETGPDPVTYDVLLTDLSVDPDYNMGTHYDPNGIVPGKIWIKWGGFGPHAADKGETIEPIMLTDQPSKAEFIFTYSKPGSYYIRHGIKDNHGTSDFVWSPPVRFQVTKW